MMNKEFRELYNSDMVRYEKGARRGYTKQFSYYFRKCQTTRDRFLKTYYRCRFKRLKDKHGIEVSYNTQIGKGLYIGHPYNITINSDSVIGENCNIHKGVTIGQENRGKRQGAPTIGNCVWIGINATIVGKVHIGNDVLIAPNAFVNCDVPDHSIVFGNPCIIKHSDHATEHYINRTV